jgi:hypothetical protein
VVASGVGVTAASGAVVGSVVGSVSTVVALFATSAGSTTGVSQAINIVAIKTNRDLLVFIYSSLVGFTGTA